MPKTALEQFDETAANNTDVGGNNIDEGNAPSTMNNAIREIMSQTAKWLGDDTLASATTTDLGSVPGRYVSVTGTTTITGLGTIKAGTIKYVKFAGALTLTHNATSLILPGAANIATAAGDTAILVSEGSGNWRCLAYQRATAGWQPPIITPWVAYTPTFTGFGTASNVSVFSRRIGDTLEVRGRFRPGTATAVEARVTLGFNGVDGGLVVDTVKNSVQQVCGVWVSTLVLARSQFMLANTGADGVGFSEQTAARASLTPLLGTQIAGTPDEVSFECAVPITGW